MNRTDLIEAINSVQIKYIKEILPKLLKNCDDEILIKDVVVSTIETYNKIKNTNKFDDCNLLLYIIDQLNIYINSELLRSILHNIRILDENYSMSLLDYVYRKGLFFDNCDLITLFWKYDIPFCNLDNNYLTYVFNHYSKIDGEQTVMYHLIKSCKIIDLLSDPTIAIKNLIHMYKALNKEDYDKYKSVYMSFEEYDEFYNINKTHENIKYFMIEILFFTMLEKIKYKSMHKLIKTIIYNRELLSYLRKILRDDPDLTKKYKNINEIASSSIFINHEHQVLLNKMIDIIFDFNTSTSAIEDNIEQTNVRSVPTFINLNS